MTDGIDSDVLGAYRAAAREEPGELLDAKVLAAARREPVPLMMWARVAAVTLMISVVALSGRQPQGLPSPDDPRYFGLYAGLAQSQLSQPALGRPDPVADALLQAGRSSPTLED